MKTIKQDKGVLVVEYRDSKGNIIEDAISPNIDGYQCKYERGLYGKKLATPKDMSLITEMEYKGYLTIYRP